jgi:hypothetical protein
MSEDLCCQIFKDFFAVFVCPPGIDKSNPAKAILCRRPKDGVRARFENRGAHASKNAGASPDGRRYDRQWPHPSDDFPPKAGGNSPAQQWRTAREQAHEAKAPVGPEALVQRVQEGPGPVHGNLHHVGPTACNDEKGPTSFYEVGPITLQKK